MDAVASRLLRAVVLFNSWEQPPLPGPSTRHVPGAAPATPRRAPAAFMPPAPSARRLAQPQRLRQAQRSPPGEERPLQLAAPLMHVMTSHGYPRLARYEAQVPRRGILKAAAAASEAPSVLPWKLLSHMPTRAHDGTDATIPKRSSPPSEIEVSEVQPKTSLALEAGNGQVARDTSNHT